MPVDRSKYPANWEAISLKIRKRSRGQCECEGQCGLHHDHRCLERNGAPARWARGKVVLTVAHLNHDPQDCQPANLRAMCQRCHLRYDRHEHKKHAAETRRRRRIAAGQLEFKT